MKRRRNPSPVAELTSKRSRLDSDPSGGIALLFRLAGVHLLFLILSVKAESATLRVSEDGNGADGLTWETAFTTIGGALTVSASGDEIWVASGTYRETVEMVTGVALYGGFAVGDSHHTDRNPRTKPAVISGETDTSPVISIDRASSVLLDGLTVTQARDGIHAEESEDLHITNCRVTSHSKHGVHLSSSTCSVSGCIISNNYIGLEYSGTAYSPQLKIIDSVFLNNSLGLSLESHPCTIDRCIASLNDDGVWLSVPGPYNIANSVIAGNTHTGVHICASSSTLSNCIVAGNSKGAYAFIGARLTLTNDCFHHNKDWSIYLKRDAELAPSRIDLLNCIVYRPPPLEDIPGSFFKYTVTHSNLAVLIEGEGNIVADPQYASATNHSGTWTTDPVYVPDRYQTVFEDARAEWKDREFASRRMTINPQYSSPWGPQYRHCCIVDNTSKTVTVWGDARELAQQGAAYKIFDYSLLPSSPCIDAGTDSGLACDIAGNPRPIDVIGVGRDGPGSYDMGCYEFQLREDALDSDINQDGCVNAVDLTIVLQDWKKVSGT